MAIHIRVDDTSSNESRRFACGIGPDLPNGDTYFFQDEVASRLADCQGCNLGGPQRLGVPISELSGRPGHPGYDRFRQIAASWGLP